MDWMRLLAYITVSVDQEHLLRGEYLATETRILKAQFKRSVTRRPRPAKPLFQRIRHSLHSLDTDARIRV